MDDATIEQAARVIAETGAVSERGDNIVENARTIAQALSDAGLLAGGWRPISEAPRDGTIIWAVFGEIEDEFMSRWSGVQVSIRHEGLTRPGGYDMGWSIMRAGIGGISDDRFVGWMPLPSPPEEGTK